MSNHNNITNNAPPTDGSGKNEFDQLIADINKEDRIESNIVELKKLVPKPEIDMSVLHEIEVSDDDQTRYQEIDIGHNLRSMLNLPGSERNASRSSAMGSYYLKRGSHVPAFRPRDGVNTVKFLGFRCSDEDFNLHQAKGSLGLFGVDTWEHWPIKGDGTKGFISPETLNRYAFNPYTILRDQLRDDGGSDRLVKSLNGSKRQICTVLDLNDEPEVKIWCLASAPTSYANQIRDVVSDNDLMSVKGGLTVQFNRPPGSNLYQSFRAGSSYTVDDTHLAQIPDLINNLRVHSPKEVLAYMNSKGLYLKQQNSNYFQLACTALGVPN